MHCISTHENPQIFKKKAFLFYSLVSFLLNLFFKIFKYLKISFHYQYMSHDFLYLYWWKSSIITFNFWKYLPDWFLLFTCIRKHLNKNENNTRIGTCLRVNLFKESVLKWSQLVWPHTQPREGKHTEESRLCFWRNRFFAP